MINLSHNSEMSDATAWVAVQVYIDSLVVVWCPIVCHIKVWILAEKKGFGLKLISLCIDSGLCSVENRKNITHA
jgi:hypothetical protein